MKIWEILKEENEGKKYKATFLSSYSLKENCIMEFTLNKKLNLVLEGSADADITYYALSGDLLKLEFEEVIDWSKVKKDTKVLVSCDGQCWSRKYFSNYKNGKIYCFRACGTSWSSLNLCDSVQEWKYCKLAQGE